MEIISDPLKLLSGNPMEVAQMLEAQAADTTSALRSGSPSSPLAAARLESLTILTEKGGVGLHFEREDLEDLVTVSRVVIGGPAWHDGMIRPVSSWFVSWQS